MRDISTKNIKNILVEYFCHFVDFIINYIETTRDRLHFPFSIIRVILYLVFSISFVDERQKVGLIQKNTSKVYSSINRL